MLCIVVRLPTTPRFGGVHQQSCKSRLASVCSGPGEKERDMYLDLNHNLTQLLSSLSYSSHYSRVTEDSIK